MLVTVSTTFIILTGPYAIGYGLYGNDIPLLLYASVQLLQYLNHSINTVLYCITGSRFRHELMKVFGCYTPKRRSTSSMGTNSTSRSIVSNSTSGNDV